MNHPAWGCRGDDVHPLALRPQVDALEGGLSAAHLRALGAGLPRLRRLRLSCCRGVSPAGLLALARAMSRRLAASARSAGRAHLYAPHLMTSAGAGGREREDLDLAGEIELHDCPGICEAAPPAAQQADHPGVAVHVRTRA